MICSICCCTNCMCSSSDLCDTACASSSMICWRRFSGRVCIWLWLQAGDSRQCGIWVNAVSWRTGCRCRTRMACRLSECPEKSWRLDLAIDERVQVNLQHAFVDSMTWRSLDYRDDRRMVSRPCANECEASVDIDSWSSLDKAHTEKTFRPTNEIWCDLSTVRGWKSADRISCSCEELSSCDCWWISPISRRQQHVCQLNVPMTSRVILLLLISDLSSPSCRRSMPLRTRSSSKDHHSHRMFLR